MCHAKNICGRLVVFIAALVLATNMASAQAPKAEKPKGGVKVKAKAAECHVADFRHLALSRHDAPGRAIVALEWVEKIGPECSIEKLTLIRNNRALWLGPADTTAIMTGLDRLIEGKAKTDVQISDALRSIYGRPASMISSPAAAATTAATPAPAAAPAAAAAAEPAAAPAAPAAPAAN